MQIQYGSADGFVRTIGALDDRRRLSKIFDAVGVVLLDIVVVVVIGLPVNNST